MELSSPSPPSPLNTILSSITPSMYSYDEGGNYLISSSQTAVHTLPNSKVNYDIDRTAASKLKGVFSVSPFSSQCTSKFVSKKKASKRRSQVKNACVNCQKACKKCDEGRPCQRCIKLGITDTCIDSPRKERKKGFKRGPYRKKIGAVPQRIVSKKDLTLQQNNLAVPQSTEMLKIEESSSTNNFASTHVSPSADYWSSQSSPSSLEKAPLYDESALYDINPNEQAPNNIAEQRFYSFYNNRSDKNVKKSINHHSFDNVSQPKIITQQPFMTNRVTDVNNTIHAATKINNTEQYNPLIVQLQSFPSDQYDLYQEPNLDYLSAVNYNNTSNVIADNFAYTTTFDGAYHTPQYPTQLVPKLENAVPTIPQNYNVIMNISNNFPNQNLYVNKNHYYTERQNYVERGPVFTNSHQWFERSDINPQYHCFYNNQQF